MTGLPQHAMTKRFANACQALIVDVLGRVDGNPLRTCRLRRFVNQQAVQQRRNALMPIDSRHAGEQTAAARFTFAPTTSDDDRTRQRIERLQFRNFRLLKFPGT